MKCGLCGQEGFANIGEVNRHKKADCPGKQEATSAVSAAEPVKPIAEVAISVDNPGYKEPASIEAIQRMATELGIGFILVKDSKFLVIPKRFLPDEVKYLGNNAYMGVKMRGYLGTEGLVVQEKTEFIR